MNQIDAVKTIIEHATVGISEDDNTEPHKYFGLGDNLISFTGDALTIYQDCLEKLFSNDKSVARSYTLKYFESELISLIRDYILNNNTMNNNTITNFFQELTNKPMVEYNILRDIYGGFIQNDKEPLSFGSFTIYNYDSHHRILNAKTPLSPDWVWRDKKPDLLIETTVKARHYQKAIELADDRFGKFDLVMSFLIGHDSRYEVGVLNFRGMGFRRAYVFSSSGETSTSHTRNGVIEPVMLDDPYFVSDEANLIWVLLSAQKLTSLQKRILLAIEWIGQSYKEVSLSSAFLKSAISLEIIFTYNEKAIINPSILNQLSESVALILGKTVDDRLGIEKEVKRLYSMRSKIAHAGKKDVATNDINTIRHIARAIVCELLSNASLNKIKTVDDLHFFLKRQKYSSGKELDQNL